MLKKTILVAVTAMGTIVVFAGLSVDFEKTMGEIRPELHSSGFGPTICSRKPQGEEDVRSMGFEYARTHDWALINSNERVCDVHHIFPLMHLDAADPNNYWFGPTDYLLKLTREEMGQKIFFRLGTSIEHSGPKVHFNTLIPEDFDKIAEIFAATVRHYNRGWANGFNWDIRYWEIWNEPDGQNNMWCLPDGDVGANDAETAAKDKLRREKFIRFYVTCLKRLKAEFGDTIKVGGPALCSYSESYFRELLLACKAAGVAPDFISWHAYVFGPTVMNEQAEAARKICDELGFAKCELIVNEWHYFNYDDYGWGDLRSADPKILAKVWEGPDGHNGIRSAVFTLAALANLQRSQLDQAYYYGCRHTGSWGFKDEFGRKYKVYYALKLFGDLIKGSPTICASSSEGTVTTLAVRGKDGKCRLLVADYGGSERRLEFEVGGVSPDAKVSCTILDHQHDLEPAGRIGSDCRYVPTFKDGKLKLLKPDSFCTAFLVEFEEVSAPIFENPVIAENWPDPTVVDGGDGWYYTHATMRPTVYRSKDLIHWQDLKADPLEPSARHTLTNLTKNLWAPSLVKLQNRWVLYLSLFINSDDNRIEALISDHPWGPFVYAGNVLTSQRIGIQNTIDPYVLESDGHVWMFFGSSQDGIHRIELTKDGLAMLPGAKPLHVAGRRKGADRKVNLWGKPGTYEGSYVMKRGAWWYLFVSGGLYTDGTYHLAVGRSASLDGPFIDRQGTPLVGGVAQPILSSSADERFTGPGHNGDVFQTADGRYWMFYHAHDAKAPSLRERRLMLQELKWTDDDWPYFEEGHPCL